MTRIANLPPNCFTQRALDMFLKVRHVATTAGGGVVFATGTPIANGVAEMFTMQRYLQLAALQDLSSIASTAGGHLSGTRHLPWNCRPTAPVTASTRASPGSSTSLSSWRSSGEVADIQTASMLRLPVPALRGGRPTVLRAPSSPELKGHRHGAGGPR